MKTLLAVLLGSSMALSFSAEAMTCSELWESNPQSKSEGFLRVSKTQPEITDEVRTESIKLCENAAIAAKKGVFVDYVLAQTNKRARGLPEEGRLSMVFMAVGGWQIGKIGE